MAWPELARPACDRALQAAARATVCSMHAYLATAAAARAGEQRLEPRDELVDLLLRDRRAGPPARHRRRRETDNAAAETTGRVRRG